MKKLLIVCGPTATGKTGLAINLAKKLYGELVSADSRQIYKKMDIGTGKDLPRNSKVQRSKNSNDVYYEVSGVKLWGYDLVEPTNDFSVSQYTKIVYRIIKDIWRRGKLPILVGGTGLYIKSVVDGIPTSNIPPNEKLRKSLDSKNPQELFEILAVEAPLKAASMNVSDRKNPRRLVRAIEIEKARGEKLTIQKSLSKSMDTLFIGLTTNIEALKARIEKRVHARIESGQEGEIKELLKSGVTWNMQSMKALGYREWKNYFEGETDKTEVTKLWVLNETKYAKRQMTWFKKDNRISWFDIGQEDWKVQVEKFAKKWQN